MKAHLWGANIATDTIPLSTMSPALIYLLLLLFLLWGVVTDLRARYIPDAVSIATFLLGLAHAFILWQEAMPSFLFALSGAVLGFSLFYLVRSVFYRLRVYHGLGLGDVKFIGSVFPRGRRVKSITNFLDANVIVYKINENDLGGFFPKSVKGYVEFYFLKLCISAVLK